MTLFLKALYFVWVIPFIIMELTNAAEYEWLKKMHKRKAEKLEDVTNEEKSDSGTLKVWFIFQMLYFAWLFVGLFSSQWVIFLFVILIGFIPKLWSKTYTYIDTFVTVALLIFAFINAAQLHIDLAGLIINYFKSLTYGR